MTNLYWILSLALAGALTGTALLRRYALSNNLIDIPNARSSHELPTPTGGGVAIAVSFVLSALLLALTGLIQWSVIGAIAVSGGGVTVIGLLDDYAHTPARWRLFWHFVSAITGLVIIGGLAPIQVFGMSLNLAWAGYVFGSFYLVWLLNLYNFMDGIDGLASMEAIFACLGGALLYFVSGHIEFVWGPIVLALAVAGFLYWNFPPARIFMGDAGSGFLGITLGLLSLQAAWVNPALLWGWLILLGVFIVDATCTLVVRLVRGDKVYEAHRNHAYQYASRQFGGHLPITLSVTGINLIWLLPIATLVALGSLEGGVGLLIAYVPLILLALRFKAGQREG
ncbi:MraY family glycosyltransferase [Pseudomonas sp. 13B_3.2_Bac1]|uniref:MraY family glycosyltransferase n=1 Tax=Pseudomonas sp. 13B_3.2_Bac1 TaxID=2971623 RepID=UPI0021CA77F6|nr:glycosyltransferase family 4 protein [Pseudomonas sp. 13B_3.2_Bac1]MCU1772390.1 glycosyltransferase family 4 protein [Pseudomonas sp. 13B_3.2_Bac1]